MRRPTRKDVVKKKESFYLCVYGTRRKVVQKAFFLRMRAGLSLRERHAMKSGKKICVRAQEW